MKDPQDDKYRVYPITEFFDPQEMYDEIGERPAYYSSDTGNDAGEDQIHWERKRGDWYRGRLTKAESEIAAKDGRWESTIHRMEYYEQKAKELWDRLKTERERAVRRTVTTFYDGDPIKVEGTIRAILSELEREDNERP